MKKIHMILSMTLLVTVLLAGCGKDTPAPTVTQMPTEKTEQTATPVPTETTAPEPTKIPTEDETGSDITGTMTVDTYPRVDGSTATLPLSEAVFMAATGESAEVAAEKVVHTKTTNSYNRLYNGEVDLLIVYEPAESIVERMKTEPLEIKPIGLDALVFLANTANPLASLTMEQLVDIYSGKVSNWAEVGGQDKELLAFQRPVGSGSQTLMQKLVMGDVAMTDGDNVFRYYTMSDILEGMLSYNNEDNTLGYSVFYYANNMYFEKDLKLMGVDGVVPSTQTIYDGSYKLTNAFYAVVRPDEPADSNARKIYDWLTSEAGQQLVLNLGYVPVQMPEGADISDAKVVQQEKTEILAKEPLDEGQYFVFVNPQNTTSEYYYGDITVYDHNWNEIANFYNVTLNHGIQGIYTNRYLPVGQIRMTAEGKQVVSYGTFDLSKGEYAVAPSYKSMEVLDAERGYYAVPKETDTEDEYAWMKWQIINGTGDVVLKDARMEDWLMIWKEGNGYREMRYDYENWSNGSSYYFYDENLKLKYVYCENAAAIPDDADRLPGVDYILMDAGGCLVDADGNVVLNSGIFLERYGDGENFDCEFKLYGPAVIEEGKIYSVKYCNKVYLLDSNLHLIRIVTDGEIAEDFNGTDFYSEFCQYYDRQIGEYVYRRYDGEEFLTSDGMVPDGVYMPWGEDGYIMHRRYGNKLFVEEYTAGGDLIKYTVPLKKDTSELMVYYTAGGYLIVNEASDEKIQSPYYSEEMLIPKNYVYLYYRGEHLAEEYGMEGADFYALDEEYNIWTVRTGERFTAPSEIMWEEDYDLYDTYSLGNYAVISGNQVIHTEDNACLIFRGNDVLFFMKGNYIYAVGNDGTGYVKALHTFLNND